MLRTAVVLACTSLLAAGLLRADLTIDAVPLGMDPGLPPKAEVVVSDPSVTGARWDQVPVTANSTRGRTTLNAEPAFRAAPDRSPAAVVGTVAVCIGLAMRARPRRAHAAA